MDSSPQSLHAADLRRKLVELTAAALKIEDELVALESEGQLKLNAATALATTRAPCTPAEKVALFLDLFGTRRSVYPKHWENEKTGKNGYSPACDNEWRPGVCHKPKVSGLVIAVPHHSAYALGGVQRMNAGHQSVSSRPSTSRSAPPDLPLSAAADQEGGVKFSYSCLIP